MRISDWSSDVCSSDLWLLGLGVALGVVVLFLALLVYLCGWDGFLSKISTFCGINFERFEKRFVFEQARPDKRSEFLVVAFAGGDRKSVVSGKSVSVRVDLGCRRIIKKKKKKK